MMRTWHAKAYTEMWSGAGVKLVLPSLLEGVDSRAWRSKQGSVQMLGAMAHCAPRQLGTALPSVVPKLSEVLSDPHPKVQSAARRALKEVGTFPNAACRASESAKRSAEVSDSPDSSHTRPDSQRVLLCRLGPSYGMQRCKLWRQYCCQPSQTPTPRPRPLWTRSSTPSLSTLWTQPAWRL